MADSSVAGDADDHSLVLARQGHDLIPPDLLLSEHFSIEPTCHTSIHTYTL